MFLTYNCTSKLQSLNTTTSALNQDSIGSSASATKGDVLQNHNNPESSGVVDPRDPERLAQAAAAALKAPNNLSSAVEVRMKGRKRNDCVLCINLVGLVIIGSSS